MHRPNGTPSSQSSSTPAASTLRPRTRRLMPDEAALDDVDVGGGGGGASPLGPRTASPLPRSHPSRGGVTSHPSASAFASAAARAPKAMQDTSTALSGLWGTSWTAIQGLATNVLGNEPDEAAPRKRRPLLATHGRSSSSAPPKQWGPPPSLGAQVGAGPQDDHESMVRALKRKDLLTASEHLLTDSVGRMKRRTSDDHGSASAPPPENEGRDALVYIHHVQPSDTLAGITIKFNCQPDVLRKANRLWPNDSVQIKKTIVLPVDACGVKGRTVPSPDAYDEDRISHSRGDVESPWTHTCWVLLPNDTTPTEIGRMPRQKLGFFPPARRKSVTFSDMTTPTTSFDLPRSSTSIHSQACSPEQSVKGRPSMRSSSSTDPRGRGRNRSTSFLLHGPGGVGTMGKDVKAPGPAQDGLNKLFAPRLPHVEPPPEQEYFTPWAPNLLEEAAITSILNGGTGFGGAEFGGSGAGTPQAGPSLDFQEIGGAIEGWMRKVGSQASKLLSEPSTPGQGRRSAVPGIGAVGGDLGDLIELRDDAFEIGDGEDEPRGRSLSGGYPSAPSNQQYQSARPDINLSIRERARKGNRNGSSSKAD